VTFLKTWLLLVVQHSVSEESERLQNHDFEPLSAANDAAGARLRRPRLANGGIPVFDDETGGPDKDKSLPCAGYDNCSQRANRK
jgi:hypothetical protein